IVYTNPYGQVMLKAYKDVASGQQWVNFYQYDLQGRVVVAADPSAVLGYDDSYADLLHWNGSDYALMNDWQGLLYRYSYAATTTATETIPGDVAGMLQYTAIQHGEKTTGFLQEVDRYFQHTAGGATVSPVAMKTVYGNWNNNWWGGSVTTRGQPGTTTRG